MDLNTVANVAEIIGAAVVLGSVVFAFAQLTQFRRQRYDMATVQLARSFQTPEFAHALRLVLSLPDGVTAEKMREDPKYEDAAMLVSLTLESVGIMVHRRITSLDMVWDLMGGIVPAVWKKMSVWASHLREEQGREKFDEWIQWLCDQMERYQQGGDPAYVKYRGWRPRRVGG